ncbi:hypothetical protein QJ856_gp0902 [Tupanvirus deep ocean]|uniref:Uncharacterized protein n=2 Tax=Tupanvirus TaxID=2094720 RepID=A0AC62A853_9VIRU|nr:hypothetical protein QJ856_gp0902 [Tupanvirus deep ocean]QKU33855.1 hypothetical protein [Tupanvirus deep ocean]
MYYSLLLIIMSGVVPIYKYDEIVLNNVRITDLNTGGCQPIAYINYEDNIRRCSTKLLVQSDYIKITQYGVQYFGDVNEEAIKIPLDPAQKSCMDLKNHLQKIDEFFGAENLRIGLFGKKANQYVYQPCVRSTNGKEYCKMKFNFILDNKKRINKTKIYDVNGNINQNIENTLTKDNNIQNRNQITADTMADIAENIPFYSTIKFIFYYSKIWVNKKIINNESKKRYGVGLKIMAILVSKFDRLPNKIFMLDNTISLYDIQSIKSNYKKYIEQKKKKINKNLLITV